MMESKLGLAGSLLGFLPAFILGFGLMLNPPEGESTIPFIFAGASITHLLGIWASRDVTRLRAAAMLAVAWVSLSLVLLFGVPLYPGVVGHEVGLIFLPSTILLLIAGGSHLIRPRSNAFR